MGGIESEREVGTRKAKRRGNGGGQREDSDMYANVYVCAMRCIGLAGREWWRRRREKEEEEKDRAVKLVCRSVTA